MKTQGEITLRYRKENRRCGMVLLGMVLAIVVLSFFSVCYGSYKLSMQQMLSTFLGRGEALHRQIIFQLRLPRVLTAVVAGIGLGVSGCVMQSLLNNPLAAASTLGVSQGASFGAAFAIICLGAGQISYQSGSAGSMQVGNPYLITLCAFVASMAVTLLVLAFSKLRTIAPGDIILIGVALSSLFSGGTALMQYFADDVDLSAIVFWTFGDLGRTTYRELGLISLVVGLTSCFFLLHAWSYNAMAAGDTTAQSLGLNLSRVRLVGLTLCSLSVATIISFVGIISFIGLVAPHIMRKVLGYDNRYLLPGSMLCGALILLISDLLARWIIAPTVLPIGTITSFMGAPLFLYILLKGRKYHAAG